LLFPSSDGSLLVAGSFDVINGVSANNIARWDGAQWLSLGGGTNGPVYACAELSNGHMVVGGAFTTAGGMPAPGIAIWNGSGWEALLSDAESQQVFHLTVLSDGSLLVSGRFRLTSSRVEDRMARWNGGHWTFLSGNIPPHPRAVYASPDDSFSIGGAFRTVGEHISSHFAHFESACGCPADLDSDGNFANGATRDNAVDINDLLYFVVGFEAGRPLVDLDDDGDPVAGTPDGAVTVDDLLFFLARFEAGC
jgi:hypothetical protein